jgi:hypothetical protein
MQDLKVTTGGTTLAPHTPRCARFVDQNILSGVSSAVLVGRDLVDVNCVGWADKSPRCARGISPISSGGRSVNPIP